MDDEDLINPERMAIFEQKMRELTLEFIETLEQWRLQLVALSDDTPSWSEEDFKEILTILHGMAGSSAIYGFAALGEEARVLENQIEEGGPHSKQRSLDSLHHLIEECAQIKAAAA